MRWSHGWNVIFHLLLFHVETSSSFFFSLKYKQKICVYLKVLNRMLNIEINFKVILPTYLRSIYVTHQQHTQSSKQQKKTR